MVDHRLTDIAPADDQIEDPVRQSRLVQDGRQRLGHCGGRSRRLHHHRIAKGQCRGRLPRRDGHGKVPRRNQAEHAHGLAPRPGLDARPDRGHRLAMQAQGLASEIAEHPPGAGHLADALGEGLALLARQQPSQRLAPLQQQGGGTVQNVGPHFRRSAGPAVKGVTRGGDGGLNLGRARLRQVGDHLIGVRGVGPHRGPVGLDPLAVDPVAQVEWRGHGNSSGVMAPSRRREAP